MREVAASMATADFVAEALRAFFESATTIYGSRCSRQADNPGLTAVQTVGRDRATERQTPVR